MKRILLFTSLIIGLFTITAYADNIDIVIDGEYLKTENMPVNINDRVLVPMRAIFEELGADIEWNEKDYSVTAVKDNNAIEVKINSDTIRLGIINSDNVPIYSSAKTIDVPAVILNDRTYVPVRAVSESFNNKVDWDAENQTVIINSRDAGDYSIFYSASDDYKKLYKVDSNGINREKLSDKSVTEVYYDDGFIYYKTTDGFLWRIKENGKSEKQVTDFDTEVIEIKNGIIYCLKKQSEHIGTLYEIGDTIRDLGEVKYPIKHNSYIYYNRGQDIPMYALNLNTYTETTVDMGDNITLSPYNCVFYGDYILVENGNWYNNIVRFNEDGSNMLNINNSNSYICRNQEEDARILYVNGDSGQDIYYVWIDGSYNAEIADMPSDCIYADVLAQNGDHIYYKNMLRKEIYRTDFDRSENIYVGYGDNISIFADKMFIEDDVLYISDLDGQNQARIYNRKITDYIADNNYVYGRDYGFGNIVKIGFDGSASFITNDKASVWTTNIK